MHPRPLFVNLAHIPTQETLFGRTVTPAERLRQNQRALAKAQRELDRERTKLEQQEKKLMMDIKKSAKAGQMVRLPLLSHPSLTRSLPSDTHRMHAKSWPKTSSVLDDTSRSSTK